MWKPVARPLLAAAVLVVVASGLGAGAGGVVSAADPAARVPLAKVPAVPSGAVVGQTLPATQPISITVDLALPDPATASALVAAVSTPSSPQYRQYLGPGQFAARFGPSPATVTQVRDWLVGQGLTVGATAADGLLLPVQGTAATVAQAFGTSLSSVRLPSGRTGFVDTVAPSVPASVSSVIQGVVGLDDLAQWRNHLEVDQSDRASAASPAVPTTGSSTATTAGRRGASPPADLAAQDSPDQAGPQACAGIAQDAQPGGPYTFNQLAGAYDVSSLYGQGRTGAGVTVALYELEPHSVKSVDTFAQCYGLAPSVTSVTVAGGPGLSNTTVEADLDIEDVAAMAPGAGLLVYQGPNSSQSGAGSGPLLTMNQIAADDRAQVVSTSWGICEAALTATAAGLENGIFQVMAAQGQTVLAAAGDEGSEGCLHTPTVPDGIWDSLAVDDPASQPDVTGVGGTALPGSVATQTVWNDCQAQGLTCQATPNRGAGGGGVSREWTMPSWQSAAGVPANSSGVTCGGANTDCREVPDVSADAAPNTGYLIYSGGFWRQVGGTSASAPLWAALIALTDQGCAAIVGLANPALYRLGSDGSGAFTDVTVASTNDLTNTNLGDYRTATGYDMATGWGTPVASTLLADLQTPGGCPAVTGLSSSHGSVTGGGTLTITGTDLSGATAVSFGPSMRGTILASSASQVVVAIPGSPYAQVVNVTVSTPNGTSAIVGAAQYAFGTPHNGQGYWLAAADGGVFSFGDAQFYGSMGAHPLNKPVVGLAVTPGDAGYWEVASDGGLFAFGDAPFYGSMGGQPLNKPIVGMATTPNGGGYWEVASDGGVFAFGDAPFYGSMGGRSLNQPIVGIAVTPNGGGYWEVAADGGLFAFGNAQFYGSMGGRPLNKPIVAMAPTVDGAGYWEVASDGGIFSFGDAQFYGSMGGQPLNKPIVATTATPDSAGYWEAASDGGIFSFGDAQFYGSTGNLTLVAPIVAMADT